MKTHEAAMILLEDWPGGLFILSEDGDILFANAEAAEMLCTEEIPPSLRDSLAWIAGKAKARIENKEYRAFEEPMKCKGPGGTAQLVRFVVRALHNSSIARED